MTSERVTSNIKVDYLHDDLILHYKVAAVDVRALEQWNDHVVSALQSLPTGVTKIGLLYDLSISGVSMPFMLHNHYEIRRVAVSPDGLEAVNAALASHPDLWVYLAVLLPDTVSGKIATGQSRDTDKLSQVEARIYSDVHAAFEWLQQVV